MTTKARRVSQILTSHRQREGGGFVVRHRPHLVEEEERVGVAECGAREGTRRQARSYSTSTLLTRTLHDVLGKTDPARRRAAIDGIFTEDGVFYDPRGVYRGRDEIASRARSRLLTLPFDISHCRARRNRATCRGEQVAK